MANKALSKRQKLMFRVGSVPPPQKPRNPIALAARQKVAGAHRKSASGQRQLHNRLLRKVLGDDKD